MKTTQILATLALSTSVAFGATTTNGYETYPSVAHTASINGFADKIYAKVPSCAQECLKQDTGSTPCPYWDTGCLCVMPQFGGPIADCIASSCKGSNVVSATSLATSQCSAAGVDDPYWYIPSTASANLATAASQTAEVAAAAATTLATVKRAVVDAPEVTTAPRV